MCNGESGVSRSGVLSSVSFFTLAFVSIMVLVLVLACVSNVVLLVSACVSNILLMLLVLACVSNVLLLLPTFLCKTCMFSFLSMCSV